MSTEIEWQIERHRKSNGTEIEWRESDALGDPAVGVFAAGVWGSSGACMYCGQQRLEKRVDIARRDSGRENDILPDHYGGLLAAGVMLASAEWPFSWS